MTVVMRKFVCCSDVSANDVNERGVAVPSSDVFAVSASTPAVCKPSAAPAECV